MCKSYLEEKKTNMMNDSDDQYGNLKSTSPKMLMDCIQFTVVMRANTHADTFRDRKSSPGLQQMRLTVTSACLTAEAGRA